MIGKPAAPTLRLKLALLPEERAALRDQAHRAKKRAPPRERVTLQLLEAALLKGADLTVTPAQGVWLACWLEAVAPRASAGSHLQRAAADFLGSLKHNLAFKARVHFRFFRPAPPRVLPVRGPSEVVTRAIS